MIGVPNNLNELAVPAKHIRLTNLRIVSVEPIPSSTADKHTFSAIDQHIRIIVTSVSPTALKDN